MTIEGIITSRGIEEILHFSTNLGLVGILDACAVKPRANLSKDRRLEFIFSPNAAFRKDEMWLGHVNLSISRINSQFFSVSSGRWHKDRDIWWCILSFLPEILTHNKVVFTTTNNIYTGVVRGPGPKGLNAMFSETVTHWQGVEVSRRASMPPNFTTCEQAEVLYPGDLSTDFLQRVYVAGDEYQDEACGQFLAVHHPPVEVVVNPGKFKPSLY